MFYIKSSLVLVISVLLGISNVLAEVAEGEIIGYLGLQSAPYFVEQRSEDSEIYRKLLKKNDDGSFIVQNFYLDTNNQESDPYTINWLGEVHPSDGVFIAWHRNGNKAEESHYKEGQRHGVTIIWYDNGQKELEINYKNGEQNGLETTWSKKGRVKSQQNYKDGQPIN